MRPKKGGNDRIIEKKIITFPVVQDTVTLVASIDLLGNDL